jgi:hypothetical protein
VRTEGLSYAAAAEGVAMMMHAARVRGITGVGLARWISGG